MTPLEKSRLPLMHIKAKLGNVDINTTLFEELFFIARNNPDQYFLLNTDPLMFPVSPALTRLSKNPGKLTKVFKRLGIYNVIEIRTDPTYYTYMGKDAKNNLMTYHIAKADVAHPKVAFGKALLDFIDQVRTGQYRTPTLDQITQASAQQLRLSASEADKLLSYVKENFSISQDIQPDLDATVLPDDVIETTSSNESTPTYNIDTVVAPVPTPNVVTASTLV